METIKQTDRRRRYYKLLAIGKKQVGIADDDYRALLARHGAREVDGEYSATTMDLAQLDNAVADLKRLGFKPKKKPAGDNKDWRAARIAKITKLWCLLSDAGVVKRREEAAMHKWAMRITHKARLEWAGSAELNQCIEALKDWARREHVAIAD